jgi:hypothetical protein
VSLKATGREPTLLVAASHRLHVYALLFSRHGLLDMVCVCFWRRLCLSVCWRTSVGSAYWVSETRGGSSTAPSDGHSAATTMQHTARYKALLTETLTPFST